MFVLVKVKGLLFIYYRVIGLLLLFFFFFTDSCKWNQVLKTFGNV